AAGYGGEQRFVELLAAKGAQAALASSDARALSMAALNEIAYQLLRIDKDLPQAIRAFELNAERFPESWSVWDSLREAYAQARLFADARRCYRKSLALEPRNTGAAAWLAEHPETAGHR